MPLKKLAADAWALPASRDCCKGADRGTGTFSCRLSYARRSPLVRLPCSPWALSNGALSNGALPKGPLARLPARSPARPPPTCSPPTCSPLARRSLAGQILLYAT